jgi:2,4-dienoyl-CoA reductase (NADPH2)
MGLMARAAGGGPPKIRVATVDDIAELVEGFASAAERAQRAGFDGVELHAAHGYIFSEFLSPAWNFREDEYGGAVENRARFLCETLRACKDRTGGGFPVWCRLDAKEFGTPGGIQLEDAKRTAELAQEAGADAISVSAYANPLGAGFTEGPIVHHEAGFAELAAGIKSRVSVPVIVAGRIEPEVGDRLVREGRADLIAMGRKLLADPELPAKLAEGRPEAIRPCIYCYVCVAQPFFDRRVKCAVNPVLGREDELADTACSPTSPKRRVLVGGGGPAGMEAARVAATRGHEVVLCEKESQLGGTLRIAALSYPPNGELLRFLEGQVRALPIEVRLGTEVDEATIREVAPEVVIAAVGATRERPAIPGGDSAHVLDGDDLRRILSGEPGAPALPPLARAAIGVGRALGLTRDPARLRAASRLYMPVGRRVAIVGGGLVGIELGEFLVARRRAVTVLEEGPVMALEMAHPRRWRVLHELREAGVQLLEGARVLAIDGPVLRYETKDGEAEIQADTVVIATGLQGNPAGIARLEAAGVPVRAVGDGSGVGYIEGAIHEGFRAALEL